MKITDQRLPFTTEVLRTQRQIQWLIELDRLLDVSSNDTSAQEVQMTVDTYLQNLMAQELEEQDALVAAHVNKTIRSLWWGLFTCYDVPGLLRTNNGLERFLRRLKTTQRRITGRKRVHDFIIRYGTFVAYLDFEESLAELLERLPSVTQEEFLDQRHLLQESLLREAKRQRFRRQRQICLALLETQWEQIQKDNL